MLISKNLGKKLDVKNMASIYGGYDCSSCGNCDCRASNGEQFYSAFDPEIDQYQATLIENAED